MIMRGWSIPAGEWFGINFRVHLAFLFLLVFAWVIETGKGDPRATFAPSLIFTVIVLVSVILHEFGHLLAAGKQSLKPRAIVLLPIGGLWLAEVLAEPGDAAGKNDTQLAQETRIALAGPFASLVVAIGIAATIYALAPHLLTAGRGWIDLHNLGRTAIWTNLFLAALNLLPGYPLDGGRVLRALLIRRMPPVLAARRAVAAGNLLVLLLMFAGLWNSWLMLTGFFLFIAAQLEERTIVFQSVLESVQMEEVMLTDFATLSPADTLEDALGKAVHTLQDDFPVVRGADMVGVVSRQRILRALRRSGNAYIQAVMDRDYETAARSDSLASAFRKITRQGLTIIPIVDQEKLVGIVTLQNLMHSMSVLAESRKLRRRRAYEE
jgi:Zn-dependent protease/CBS domain-containing protein